MRAKYGLFLALVGATITPSWVMGQQPSFWQPALDTAKRVATQTHRPMLIFFHSDSCPACRTMDQNVFSQPAVVADLQANFVPVRVNAESFPITAQKFGVNALPTTVVVSPEGQVLDVLRGGFDANQYMGRLNQVAARARQSAVARSGPAGPQQVDPAPQPPITATPVAARPQPGSPPVAAARPPVDAAVGPPPANPPLGLDGYCPVCLMETKQWVQGDRRWGLRHRGRTYLFNSADDLERFNADPDRYAPVISGNDVVLAVEQGQTVPGYRQHGVYFGSRIFLFANEASLKKFSDNPGHYANQALQALRTGVFPGQQLR